MACMHCMHIKESKSERVSMPITLVSLSRVIGVINNRSTLDDTDDVAYVFRPHASIDEKFSRQR